MSNESKVDLIEKSIARINSEDSTQNLTEDGIAQMSDSDKLTWLMRTVGGIDERLTRLEARFDGRDTNPLLPPNFVDRFTVLEEEVRLIDHMVTKLAGDSLKTSAQAQDLMRRMQQLDKQKF